MKRSLCDFLRILAKTIGDMAFKDVDKLAEGFYQDFLKSDEGQEASDKALKNHPEYKRGDTAKAVDEIMTTFHSWLGRRVESGKTFGAIYSLVKTKMEAGIS